MLSFKVGNKCAENLINRKLNEGGDSIVSFVLLYYVDVDMYYFMVEHVIVLVTNGNEKWEDCCSQDYFPRQCMATAHKPLSLKTLLINIDDVHNVSPKFCLVIYVIDEKLVREGFLVRFTCLTWSWKA